MISIRHALHSDHTVAVQARFRGFSIQNASVPPMTPVNNNLIGSISIQPAEFCYEWEGSDYIPADDVIRDHVATDKVRADRVDARASKLADILGIDETVKRDPEWYQRFVLMQSASDVTDHRGEQIVVYDRLQMARHFQSALEMSRPILIDKKLAHSTPASEIVDRIPFLNLAMALSLRIMAEKGTEIEMPDEPEITEFQIMARPVYA